jgi:glycosyltransferase involved in cell wall biosynthesis
MKILWVKTDFLHPTDRGGQIRTLETLRRLHRAHEIHYVAYDNPTQPEGVRRSSEYATRAYPVDRPIPRRNSPAFFGQLVRNLFSPLPLAVGRYASSQMHAQISTLLAAHNFDSVVCDFLSVAPNFPDLSRAVLFQHNVETMIWRRHAEHARDPLRRAYFQLQAKRMFACERHACQSAAHVIAVSRNDAEQMRQLFGVANVSEIATGVDLDYFRRPDSAPAPTSDLVFVGAMDWLANIDGVRYFTTQVLPIIRRARPRTSLVLAGRSPVPEVRALAATDPLIQVTGTVPDIRPYLWNAAVSIVPLRIGGGTRLKIYEAMAAGVPVVATAVGAEGLAVENARHIHLADSPESFAARCLELLENPARNRSLSAAALDLVSAKFSWEQVATRFAAILESTGSASAQPLRGA